MIVILLILLVFVVLMLICFLVIIVSYVEGKFLIVRCVINLLFLMPFVLGALLVMSSVEMPVFYVQKLWLFVMSVFMKIMSWFV